nr:hypothetical protein [Tanacetum cinerariifolium]
MRKFNAIYTRLQRLSISGENEVYLLARVRQACRDESKAFAQDNEWKILKKRNKWDAAESVDLIVLVELFENDARPQMVVDGEQEVYATMVAQKGNDGDVISSEDSLKDSIDQTDLANLDDLFVDPTPEKFTNEHAPDYSFSSRFDVYPDDFLEIESDADNFYDDHFDSKGEKIKESKLLIDELDLPYVPNSMRLLPFSSENEEKVFKPGIYTSEKVHSCFLLELSHPEYDSFASQDFFRDDDLPSPDNEDKDFYPPFYEPLVFKDVPNSMRLLPFSSENEEKVFKPVIYTYEKVHFCFLLELSHPENTLSSACSSSKGNRKVRVLPPLTHLRTSAYSFYIPADEEFFHYL